MVAEKVFPSSLEKSEWEFVGYEVADGYLHSAMIGRYSEKERERYKSIINRHGLIPDYTDAIIFQEWADETCRPHFPFYIYGVRRKINMRNQCYQVI